MEQDPDVDYRPVARAAGLDDQQLAMIEQLFGVQGSSDIFAAQLRVYCACERIQQKRVGMNAVQGLLAEQSRVETEIRAAFEGVTREGGTSWSEGFAIDLGGSEEEYACARASDREQSWEQLVDDPKWHPDGPWCFLDAIGFRYYLAPAMIRKVRDGSIGSLAYSLQHPLYEEELRALLTPAQSTALHDFLLLILDVGETFDWSRDRLELCEMRQVKTA